MARYARMVDPTTRARSRHDRTAWRRVKDDECLSTMRTTVDIRGASHMSPKAVSRGKPALEPVPSRWPRDLPPSARTRRFRSATPSAMDVEPLLHLPRSLAKGHRCCRRAGAMQPRPFNSVHASRCSDVRVIPSDDVPTTVVDGRGMSPWPTSCEYRNE